MENINDIYMCIYIYIYIYIYVILVLLIAPTGAVHLADLMITLQIQKKTILPPSETYPAHASPSSLI